MCAFVFARKLSRTARSAPAIAWGFLYKECPDLVQTCCGILMHTHEVLLIRSNTGYNGKSIYILYIWYGYQLLVSKQSSAFLVWHVGDLKKLLHLLKSLKAFASYLRFRILGTIHDVIWRWCQSVQLWVLHQQNKPQTSRSKMLRFGTPSVLLSPCPPGLENAKNIQKMPRDELNFDLPSTINQKITINVWDSLG